MIAGHGTTDEGTREGVSRTLNQHLVWCTGIVKALIGQDQIIGHVIPYQDTTLFDVILREAAKQLNRLFILNNGATALTDNLHIHTTLIQVHKLVIVERDIHLGSDLGYLSLLYPYLIIINSKILRSTHLRVL